MADGRRAGEAGVWPLGMFPLSTVLFPHAELPLHVFETRYQRLIADCLGPQGDHRFGVVLIDRGSEVGGGDHRVGVGTVARITSAALLPDHRVVLTTIGTERIVVRHWLDESAYPTALVETLVSTPASDALALGGGLVDDLVAMVEQAAASLRRALALLSELGESHDVAVELDLSGASHGASGDLDLDRLAWELCARAPVSLFDRQRLLEIDDPVARLGQLIELVDARADDARHLLAEGPRR